jgi:tetratricopeptide (TPR) repeat protein
MPPDDALSTALAHHRAGNLPRAEDLYRQVLATMPESADAWHLLGALCLQAGRPAEAVEAISRAIQLDATKADYFSHLGAAQSALGEHEAAIASLRHAVRLAPQSAGVHYNLGTALMSAKRLEDAVLSFRHAVAADPNSAEAHYNLANALRDLARFDEAEAGYRAAVRIRPRYTKALINLGNLLTHWQRYDEAVEILREAVAVDPRYANAHLNLGSVLRDARRFDEAVESLRTAVALEPNSAEAHNNLGTAYQALGRFDEARAECELALTLDPDLPDAHFSRAIQLLRSGDLARGFAEYEWRWKCKSFSTRCFDQPRWNGEPLSGRTILLYAEQGLGDALQFARYAADAKAAGGTVIVECPESVMPILGTIRGIDRLVPFGSPSPPFDVHGALMSLPGVLGLSIDHLWRGAYLAAEPARVETWRRKLAGVPGFRVGICWQGNPKHLFDDQRSFPLSRFAPLARVPGVRLVSLQKGFGSEQLANSTFDVVDLGADLDRDAPFLDTAAVMHSLDLVISADTATAHLAGGLGIPVWLALSAHADWRWFVDRADTPWYPTMRLFRQARLGDWEAVFAGIAAALAMLVRG